MKRFFKFMEDSAAGTAVGSGAIAGAVPGESPPVGKKAQRRIQKAGNDFVIKRNSIPLTGAI